MSKLLFLNEHLCNGNSSKNTGGIKQYNLEELIQIAKDNGINVEKILKQAICDEISKFAKKDEPIIVGPPMVPVPVAVVPVIVSAKTPLAASAASAASGAPSAASAASAASALNSSRSKDTLLIFDFDCTLSSRHFWGLMNGRPGNKIKPEDVGAAVDIQTDLLIGNNVPTGTRMIKPDLTESEQNQLVDYIFGSKDRLKELRKFFSRLCSLPNVRLEIWSRSYFAQLENLLRQPYIKLDQYFPDEGQVKGREVLDDIKYSTFDPRYKNIYLFDDSQEEFEILLRSYASHKVKDELFDILNTRNSVIHIFKEELLPKESGGIDFKYLESWFPVDKTMLPVEIKTMLPVEIKTMKEALEYLDENKYTRIERSEAEKIVTANKTKYVVRGSSQAGAFAITYWENRVIPKRVRNSLFKSSSKGTGFMDSPTDAGEVIKHYETLNDVFKTFEDNGLTRHIAMLPVEIKTMKEALEYLDENNYTRIERPEAETIVTANKTKYVVRGSSQAGAFAITYWETGVMPRRVINSLYKSSSKGTGFMDSPTDPRDVIKHYETLNDVFKSFENRGLTRF
jgi:hypothetical protein